MKVKAWVMVLLASAAPSLHAEAAPHQDERFSEVRELIEKEIASGTMSMAVAVAENGRIVWEEGFGWADREAGVRADARTPYVLASVSKPITTTGLMVLAEQGRIDLDRPINDYLGEVKLVARVGDARDATVRRVANHTAGLGGTTQAYHVDEPYRRPPQEQTILRYGNIVMPPGKRWKYSNFGYGVLEYAIAQASGRSFAGFMQDEVFSPLGMTRSSASPDLPTGRNLAAPYRKDGTRISDSVSDFVGYGDIQASAHDLARFGMFHLKHPIARGKRVLSSAGIDQLHRPSHDSGWWGIYALGWFLKSDSEGRELLFHSGASFGARAFIGVLPGQDVAIAIVSNGDTDAVDRVRDGILARVGFKGPFSRDWSGDAAAPRPPVSEALLGDWSGAIHTYRGDVALSVSIFGDGRIGAKVGLGPDLELKGATIREDGISVELPAQLDTDDAIRRAHTIRLDVSLYDGVLIGNAETMVPWPRTTMGGNFLSHWVDLRRSGAAPSGTGR